MRLANRKRAAFISESDNKRLPWTWKPEGTGLSFHGAMDVPIYPSCRRRRHSFPPPSSYSVKKTPRWATERFPPKDYTHAVPFRDMTQLSEYDAMLPDGFLWKTPTKSMRANSVSVSHNFSARGQQRIARRMSGSLEGVGADTEMAKNPAFIARYCAPRAPMLARLSAC